MPTVHTGLLVAGVIAAFVGVFSIFLTTMTVEPPAKMELTPQSLSTTVGQKFTIQIVVESTEPVNVFGGELTFDSSVIAVDSIDYNTSIADLWAELPWFSNGDGTLNFGGGTTQKGGFTGKGQLITVTFKTLKPGNGHIAMKMPRILRHDGQGTDIPLKDVVDAVVEIEKPVPDTNLIAKSSLASTVTVTPENAPTDLNGDGKQTLADVSIFMLNIAENDPRFDFNGDGKVNTQDLAILLSTH